MLSGAGSSGGQPLFPRGVAQSRERSLLARLTVTALSLWKKKKRRTMPAYKLYYFHARGAAELVRFLFAQAGVEYEDVRLALGGEEWAKLKPNTPWGVMPFIEEDGTQISGSAIIARYLGEKYGLAGSSEVENAKIASAVDAVADVGREVGKFVFEKDEERKAALKKELEEKTLPSKLQFFENLIAKSTAPEGWMFNKVTYADFAVAVVVGGIITDTGVGGAVDKFPKIRALQQAVENLPKIKEWIEKRPKTDF